MIKLLKKHYTYLKIHYKKLLITFSILGSALVLKFYYEDIINKISHIFEGETYKNITTNIVFLQFSLTFLVVSILSITSSKTNERLYGEKIIDIVFKNIKFLINLSIVISLLNLYFLLNNSSDIKIIFCFLLGILLLYLFIRKILILIFNPHASHEIIKKRTLKEVEKDIKKILNKEYGKQNNHLIRLVDSSIVGIKTNDLLPVFENMNYYDELFFEILTRKNKEVCLCYFNSRFLIPNFYSHYITLLNYLIFEAKEYRYTFSKLNSVIDTFNNTEVYFITQNFNKFVNKLIESIKYLKDPNEITLISEFFSKLFEQLNSIVNLEDINIVKFRQKYKVMLEAIPVNWIEKFYINMKSNNHLNEKEQLEILNNFIYKILRVPNFIEFRFSFEKKDKFNENYFSFSLAYLLIKLGDSQDENNLNLIMGNHNNKYFYKVNFLLMLSTYKKFLRPENSITYIKTWLSKNSEKFIFSENKTIETYNFILKHCNNDFVLSPSPYLLNGKTFFNKITIFNFYYNYALIFNYQSLNELIKCDNHDKVILNENKDFFDIFDNI